MSFSGNNLRQEHINDSKQLLSELFADDSSYGTNIYKWELNKNNYTDIEPIRVRFYERNFQKSVGTVMKFQTLIDTPVFSGDILFDSNKNEYWICIESFNINDIHWQGTLYLCTYILKWQNAQGYILEYPCYTVNATQFNAGETAYKQFTIGSSRHQITLPYDENTSILTTPQRFYLDKNTVNPKTYIVTQNDTISHGHTVKGLTKITVVECASDNSTDRPDLGICDYKDFNVVSDNFSETKAIIDYQTNIIKSGGDKQIFIGRFYNGDSIIDDIEYKWEIKCDFLDYLNVTQDNNILNISIDNDDYIDEEFKIIFSDIDNQYQNSLIVKVESLL